jgi:transglutaminase superfamily protein
MRSWSRPLSRRLALVRGCGTQLDPWLVARIVAFATATLALGRLRPSRLRTAMRWLGHRGAPRPIGASRVLANLELALDAGRPLVPNGCLTRGLTRLHFLRRAGMEVSLCFGVGRPLGEVAGHCWLVRDGEPYLESTDPTAVFTPVLRLP